MEVISQILDALAFLLVTPEFLEEQTLGSIRSHLEKISDWITLLIEKSWGSRKRSGPLFLIVLSAYLIFNVAGFIFGVPPNSSINLTTPSVIIYVSGTIMIGVIWLIMLFYMMALLADMSARLVIRRRMFGLGVLLFFLARVISVWHAWGT